MAAAQVDKSIPKECLSFLKERFGHSDFFDMQWKVISSILNENRDNLLVMATNSGKSLCYQFPSLYRDTITIVVSPLIAQMQDQVNFLNTDKESSCFLGSAQRNRGTFSDIVQGEYNIIYATPEYITSDIGFSLIRQISDRLELIAIDGAHCISKCGSEYRPAFLELSKLRERFSEIPILALTATANSDVREDIIECLQLRDPQIIITSLDRPNFEFIVKPKTLFLEEIGPLVESVKDGLIIIYCITKRESEWVSGVLNQKGFPSKFYHGALDPTTRNTVYEDFINNRIRVVASTIAFGLGINKTDVRLIINYGPAKHIESYYQQVGVAGRDGSPAKCVMYYDFADWEEITNILRYYSLNNSMSQQEADIIIQPMIDYVHHKECRRRFILTHFGEDCSQLPANPNCCDNCNNAAENGENNL